LKRSDQIKVGITGGIGSGKSIVSRVIEVIGYPVYYSDARAKKLLHEDNDLKEGLIALLGEEIYQSGILNRVEMASRIFADPELRKSVNELIHPVVRSDFDQWSSLQKGSLVFNEAAILFETGAYKRMDLNALITCPVDLRVQRVMRRDNVSKKEVEARIAVQMTDEEKKPLADFVIINDEVQPLIGQVEKMIEGLKINLASQL